MTYPLKQVEHAGLLSPPVPLRLNSQGQVGSETLLAINQTLAAIVKHINSGLSIGDGSQGSQTGNTRNQWLAFVSPGTANVEFEMPHGLGRTPFGFTVWFQDKAGSIYVSNFGSWNRDRILLKCSVATLSGVIELG